MRRTRCSRSRGGARAEAGVAMTFERGDAHALDFPDRSFDAAVSLRVLMHTPGWRGLRRASCAASAARASSSTIRRQRARRRFKRPAGAWQRASGVRWSRTGSFLHRAIEATLAREGFAVTAVHRQFVLPIALHKAIGSLRFTQSVETTWNGSD